MIHFKGIKPCPACSHKKTLIRKEEGFFIPGILSKYWVECRNCKARGPRHNTITHAILAYNAMPRREEIHAELMELHEDHFAMWGQLIEPAGRMAVKMLSVTVKELAKKYTPEDSG